MEESQKYLNEWVIKFLTDHFNEIDLVRCEWDVKTIEEAIKEINEKDFMSGWVIGEVMSWGMKDGKDWSEQYEQEIHNGEMTVYKLGERYFSYHYTHSSGMMEVFPKYKQILYFDDNKK